MTVDNFNFQHFLEAQEDVYTYAVNEMALGKKEGHWMWFIFPQLKGLGRSETSEKFGISGLEEATAFLHHDILGNRLKNITTTLIAQPENNATKVFGSPDDLKLKSCMTLFSQVEYAPDMFQKALDKFFGGEMDAATLRMLEV